MNFSKGDYFGEAPMIQSAFGPGNKLASRIHRGLDMLQACSIHAALDTHERTAMLSAGGPGKGMYTRLYLNVLNR